MSASPEPLSRSIPGESVTLHALDWNPAGSPTVLLCHGWLDHAHGFDWVCAALPASWRRVALDFRGHGRSSHLPPGAGYGLDGYLADVELALEGEGRSVSDAPADEQERLWQAAKRAEVARKG